MSRKLSFFEMAVGGYKFLDYLVNGGLFNINLEVTKRCNARCDFCDYWKEKPPAELNDYVPLVKKLAPLSVSLTGGEPLLREDLEEIIGSLRRNFSFLFISLITNGALLDLERGMRLWEAGLDEFSISLDYMDERHDQGRKIPGLTRHILSVAPQLRDRGVNLCFNLVIKKENFRELPQIIRQASDMGIKLSLSTYNGRRNDNGTHMIDESEVAALENILGEVLDLKKSLGTVTTGEYYLRGIPEFCRTGSVTGCTAGLNWVQVTPDGMVKRCSDRPVACEFTQWEKGFFGPTRCSSCWYSCRGAAQEPMTFKRFAEMAKDALS